MRIDAITPGHASNVERASAVPTRSNAASFREVLSFVRAERSGGPASVEQRWSADDVEAFAVFVEANRRTESGGSPTFSTLRTTAGSGHRASFGVAQLSIREHLARLSLEPDTRLAALGTSRAEVGAMQQRGEAMAALYHLIVDGRERSVSSARLGIDDAQARRIDDAASSGDITRLRALLGGRFEASTGVDVSAVDDLVLTRALRDPEMRDAFLAQYEHDHGAAFDPVHRDGACMAQSARHVALAHPQLARVLASLGDDDGAAISLGHYLGVGDSAENLLGWHARAAATACGTDRFSSLLAAIDTTTSRARETEDFERALAATAGISDLSGEARVATLARIGRLFHGSPTRAREALFVDGHLDAPRCRTRAELDALLDQLRSGRTWSDARLAGHVAQVVAERSTS